MLKKRYFYVKICNMKSGFTAIIGRPNVGKSTLLNKILGQKIVITTDKAQTTRKRIKGIYTTEEGQIVFIDTPGVHKPLNKLGEFLLDELRFPMQTSFFSLSTAQNLLEKAINGLLKIYYKLLFR